MTTVLVIKDWNYEEYYQQSLDYYHAKFFSHPDVLSGYQPTEAELQQLSCPGIVGSHSGDDRHSGKPTGKLVL